MWIYDSLYKVTCVWWSLNNWTREPPPQKKKQIKNNKTNKRQHASSYLFQISLWYNLYNAHSKINTGQSQMHFAVFSGIYKYILELHDVYMISIATSLPVHQAFCQCKTQTHLPNNSACFKQVCYIDESFVLSINVYLPCVERGDDILWTKNKLCTHGHWLSYAW